MTDADVPTTEQVRDLYAYNEWDTHSSEEEPRRAEFDRWLAAHDRDTWNAGFAVGYSTPLNADLTTIRNPHEYADV